ncbi:hypothetical protein [Prevotella falsenii]
MAFLSSLDNKLILNLTLGVWFLSRSHFSFPHLDTAPTANLPNHHSGFPHTLTAPRQTTKPRTNSLRTPTNHRPRPLHNALSHV